MLEITGGLCFLLPQNEKENQGDPTKRIRRVIAEDSEGEGGGRLKQMTQEG